MSQEQQAAGQLPPPAIGQPTNRVLLLCKAEWRGAVEEALQSVGGKLLAFGFAPRSSTQERRCIRQVSPQACMRWRSGRSR